MRLGLEDRRTMGIWLAAKRESTGLTQEQAGVKIGMSRIQIARWETGASTPSWEATERIAGAYGLRVDEVRQQCGYADTIGGLSRSAMTFAQRYDRLTAKIPAERRKALDRTLEYVLSDGSAAA